jgi:transcriptional regulator with XRE-family HTH domain
MSNEERRNFSNRLQQSLRNADYAPDSPTQLAREFNLRFSGRPISVHAARKWLVGEAIPTQEKLRALADWFGVSAEWLRFGTDEAVTSGKREFHLQPRDHSTLTLLHRLDEKHRHIADTMIRMLADATPRRLPETADNNHPTTAQS